MNARTWAAAAAVLWLGGCAPESGFADLYPIIVVDPERVDFGEVGVAEGVFAERSIFVSNAGLKDLEVTSIALDGPADVFALDQTALTVADGDEAEIVVRFTPKQKYRDYTGRVVIESSDEETPVVTVPITGTGSDEPFPNITILPRATVESDPDITVGSSDQLTFDIKNTGAADLVLGEITIEQDGATFTPVYLPSGTLGPGAQQSVLVAYSPDDEVGELGTVHIPSNDPDTPDAVVQLVGNGGGPEYQPPEAIIACPAEVPLTGPQYVHLDGSQSNDPAGFDLTYQWLAIRPPGSDQSIPLDPDDTEAVDLYVDVAGTWFASLTVTNELGAVSEPAICTFEAIPEDDIHVELTWNTPSADMDLHLVQNGFELFTKPEDCYWCNKTPDWGVSGDLDDDPRLDIDDLAGYGPENINVFAPVDGAYNVAVHYWQSHGDGTVVATINVWVEGVNVYSTSLPMDHNDMWDVGQIVIDSASGSLFLPGPVVTYDPGSVGCQQ
ncbi:MAG: choice-of-anchor D domain-containing protein [Myxococcota bacterium]